MSRITNESVVTSLADADVLYKDNPTTGSGQIAVSDLKNQFQAKSEKGVANGYASLDALGLVTASQLQPAFTIEEVADATTRDALTITSGEVGKRLVRLADTGVIYLANATGSGSSKWTVFNSMAQATTSALGVVELATEGEGRTGTSSTLAMSPLATKAAIDQAVASRAPRGGLISTGDSPAGTTQDNTALAFGAGAKLWLWYHGIRPSHGVLKYLQTKFASNLGWKWEWDASDILRLRIGNGSNFTTLAFAASQATGLIANTAARIDALADFAAGTLDFYVNGAKLGTTISLSDATAQTLDNTGPLLWGSDGTTHFVGTYMDGGLAKTALPTATDIANIYRDGSIAPFCSWSTNTTTGQQVPTLGSAVFVAWPDFGRADPTNNPIAWDRSGNNQHAVLGASGLNAIVPQEWRNTAPAFALNGDGSNGSFIRCALNAQNPGTGDCTLVWEGIFAQDATSDARTLAALCSSTSDPAVSKSLWLYYNTSGVNLNLYGGTTSDRRLLTSAQLAAAMVALGARGISTALMAVRSSSGMRILFGIGRDARRFADVTSLFTASTFGTAPAWTDEIDGDYLVGIYRNSTVSSAQKLSRLECWNVALTEDQARQTFALGRPGPEWVGGTNNNVSQDGKAFSLGAADAAVIPAISGQGFGGVAPAAIAGTRTGGAGSYVLQITANGVGAFANFQLTNIVTPPIRSGQSVSLRGWARRTVGVGSLVTGGATVCNSDAWTQFDVGAVVNAGTGASQCIQLMFSGNATGDKFELDDIEIIPHGVTARLRTDTAVGSQAKNDAASPTNEGTHFELSTSGLTRSPSAQIGERQTITKTYAHSDISSTAGTTAHGSLPPGWVVREIQRNRATAFDTGITLDIGISGTSGKFASALAADSTGFAQSAAASLVPESASASTTIYIKKSGATTQGATTITLVIERVF